MHEEDLRSIKSVEEILEKELRQEMKKVIDAGAFTPGQTKTLSEAVGLMLSINDLKHCGEENSMSYGQYPMRSYIPRNPSNGRYMSRGYSYDHGYSGHSTKDRMIAALEDVMGEVHNEYEAQMVREAINHIQTNN